MVKNVIIMGAAGRDFHVFNTCYRGNKDYNVVAFTATQIPDIDDRKYPAALAGELYPNGIQIKNESMLAELIKEEKIAEVIFAYSDVTYDYILEREKIARDAGAEFKTFDVQKTMLKSSKPVIAICAVRTGVGKSSTSRKVTKILLEKGRKVVAIRHPMPYGDLEKQEVQRFSSIDDMKKHNCTIEEMEEYEPYVTQGMVVYAGIDYEKILREAEKEADIIVWDGGNNDTPFIKPDLHITLVDPLRPGDELKYFPGKINLELADVVIINKVDTATKEQLDFVETNIKKHNPTAKIIKAESPIKVTDEMTIKGKKVLVIEDGPTLTHGGMKFGAGIVAAKKYGAKEIVDPRPYIRGKIKETFEEYPEIGTLLPAMGYSEEQLKDLELTINSAPVDVVIVATPINLGRILNINKPSVRVTYTIESITKPGFDEILSKF